MSILRSASSDPADIPPLAMRILAADSGQSDIGTPSHSECGMTRAEAAHAGMLEALRGDAWVRMRLDGAGFDVIGREPGEPVSVSRSRDAVGFQRAANDAFGCKG